MKKSVKLRKDDNIGISSQEVVVDSERKFNLSSSPMFFVDYA
jgi:hypothetical protein